MRIMDKKHLLAAVGLVACSIFLSIDLLKTPKSASNFHEHRRMRAIELSSVGANGPESITFDPNGEGPYTGVSDGRILKWGGEEIGGGWLEYASVSPPHMLKECNNMQDVSFEHLCGRPLGLQFDERSFDLYIADAYFGLMKVGPSDKFATPVVTHVNGFPLHFTNSLDIDQDTGIIYFTDSSSRFRRREHMEAVISGDRSGKVMSYNPRTNEVQVLLTDLSFPNGVALSSDGSFILIAETTTCRILKHWIHHSYRPELSNKTEILIELPGFPDNIKRSPRGGFWVALHSRRGFLGRWLLSFPSFVRELFLRLPLDVNWAFSRWRSLIGEALALRISEHGEILEFLEDFGGGLVKHISEVEEYRNGTMLVGSPYIPYVGVYKL